MRSLVIAVGSLLVPAIAHAGINMQGINMQGINMQGINMQGINMQGINMQGINMQGINMQGVTLGSVSVAAELDGSRIVGNLIDQQGSCAHALDGEGSALPANCAPCSQIVADMDPYCAYYGWDGICVWEAVTYCAFDSYDLIGARFTATLSNNTTIPLRLDAVSVAPDPDPTTPVNENGDVLHHSFSILHQYWGQECDPDYGCWWQYNSEWVPACGADNRAIAVPGQWNDCVGGPNCGGMTPGTESTSISLGCSGVGAIAKCVENMGYKPWTSRFHQLRAPDLQACVRMARADYCGDGMSHTITGTKVDLYDLAGVQTSTTTWGEEALWNEHGAWCIVNERYEGIDPNSTYPTLGRYIEDLCPGKFFRAGGSYADRWRCGVTTTTTIDPATGAQTQTVTAGQPVLDADPNTCQMPSVGATSPGSTACEGAGGGIAWSKRFNAYLGNKSCTLGGNCN